LLVLYVCNDNIFKGLSKKRDPLRFAHQHLNYFWKHDGKIPINLNPITAY
jgi:hypothetical protein